MKWIRFPGTHSAGRFEDIYEQYYSAVYNYTYRILLRRQNTEDIVSETFVKAMQAFDGYRGGEKALLAWLCRIARNCVMDFLKSQAVKTSVSLDEMMERGDLPVDNSNGWEHNSTEWEAWEILRQLRPPERELLTMRYWMGLSDKEIGQRLGITEKAVSARFHRALEKCRKLVNQT